MKNIVLISCVSKKLPHKAKAQDIYISPLFKKHLQYARRLNADGIYILSAKYGLLDLDKEIEPYDMTLNKMKTNEIKTWSHRVLEQLSDEFKLNNTHITFLAGNNYRKFLIGHLKHYDVPFQGLPIGKLLQKLTEELS